ncbi:hypothetical protein C2E23DRAFT_271495 [Lenzites betulinus]|nr:hypothetical protein C2E23DRAFT_271495 [Lenzites betulinus]
MQFRASRQKFANRSAGMRPNLSRIEIACAHLGSMSTIHPDKVPASRLDVASDRPAEFNTGITYWNEHGRPVSRRSKRRQTSSSTSGQFVHMPTISRAEHLVRAPPRSHFRVPRSVRNRHYNATSCPRGETQPQLPAHASPSRATWYARSYIRTAYRHSFPARSAQKHAAPSPAHRPPTTKYQHYHSASSRTAPSFRRQLLCTRAHLSTRFRVDPSDIDFRQFRRDSWARGELVRRRAHVSLSAAPILGTPRLPARAFAACSPNPSAFQALRKSSQIQLSGNIVRAQAEIRDPRSGNVSVCDATLTTVCLPQACPASTGDQIPASPLESTSKALVAMTAAPARPPACAPRYRANRRRVQFRPCRVASWARAPIRAVRAVFVPCRRAQTCPFWALVPRERGRRRRKLALYPGSISPPNAVCYAGLHDVAYVLMLTPHHRVPCTKPFAAPRLPNGFRGLAFASCARSDPSRSRWVRRSRPQATF